MNIKILGTGCSSCIRLEKNVIEALKLADIEATVEKVTKVEDIIAYGIMSTPALVVDEKLLFYARVPTPETLKRYFIQIIEQQS